MRSTLCRPNDRLNLGVVAKNRFGDTIEPLLWFGEVLHGRFLELSEYEPLPGRRLSELFDRVRFALSARESALIHSQPQPTPLEFRCCTRVVKKGRFHRKKTSHRRRRARR